MRHPPRWWNSDVPFPPSSHEHWSPLRRRFAWRFGVLMFLMVVFACGAFTLLFWLGALTLGILNLPEPTSVLLRGSGVAIFLIGMGALLFTLRSFRRAAEPIGELIDASQRVARGDYALRVQERGPFEMRSLTRAFNDMAARLNENDAQRRHMLADISHDLRTPLTVIQGNLEGILDGVYPPDREHLEPVLDETRQMARLIQDLRIMALTEAGALQLALEPTDLTVLINETAASLRTRANTATVTLQTVTVPGLPPAECDPARIRQVLENLIGNALRYTEPGGMVWVKCETYTDKNVLIAVQDTGRGISPQDLPHIFERLYKASDSGGSGLGLAIASGLVRAHGGEIWAESELGKGTVISFTLPRERTA